jgi:alpha-L-rhamnosidase
VQSLHDYVQFTGDELILDQLYPVLKQFLSYLTQYENPSTGLLDIPSGEWWETALIDWQGETSRSGQSTALNALYYHTLLSAANLADVFSQSSDAAIWRKRAEEIEQQVNSHLFLPDQDRYIASILSEKELPPTPHAQAWPLACDLVPPENTAAVAKSLEELLPNVGVYGMFWVLEGFGHSRDIPLALEIIKTRYGQMLALGATTWWEGFSSHLNYSASLSHAWGGGRQHGF